VKRKTALITGITGQDGSYMAELLLQKDYRVIGMRRRSATENTGFVPDGVELAYGDMGDQSSLDRTIINFLPDEVYNFAAQSHVAVSFDMPEYTMDVNASGTVRLLESIRKFSKSSKFYQASSSEMFGNSPDPQNEKTPFNPQSPYAISKVAAHYTTLNYRAHGIKTYCGILFNHESPRRGKNFVTQKIIRGAWDIKMNRTDELRLGNLHAKRDWGYAPDYMDAIWRMVQLDVSDYYVIGTGETRSVQDFVELVFGMLGLNWQKFVKTDPNLYRPADVPLLRADYSKAEYMLGWKPKTSFKEMVRKMVYESEVS